MGVVAGVWNLGDDMCFIDCCLDVSQRLELDAISGRGQRCNGGIERRIESIVGTLAGPGWGALRNCRSSSRGDPATKLVAHSESPQKVESDERANYGINPSAHNKGIAHHWLGGRGVRIGVGTRVKARRRALMGYLSRCERLS